MAKRYSVCDLREDVAIVNGWAEKSGFPARLEIGGRNGYQAIDEYSVGADGEALKPGCADRNVCCGSYEDCGFAAYRWYSNRAQEWGEAGCDG